jgi:signal transduction histidine kinase
VASIAIVAAIVFEISPAPDQGLRLAYENGQVVVASADYGTTAQRSGITPGDIVVRLDSVTSDVNWSIVSQQVLEASDADKMLIAQSRGPWAQILTVPRQYELPTPPRPDLPGGGPAIPLNATPQVEWHFLDVFYPFNPAPLAVGLSILILGWWWLGSGRAGTTLRSYALTLPVATAVPLLVLPLGQYPSALATIIGSLLVPLGMLPLAIDFLGHVDGTRRRRLVAASAVGLAAGSAAAGLLYPVSTGMAFWNSIVQAGLIVALLASLLLAALMAVPVGGLNKRQRWLIAGVAGGLVFWFATASVAAFSDLHVWRAFLAGGVAFVPGLFAARPFQPLKSGATIESGATPRALIESADVALAAATPGMAAFGLVVAYSGSVLPILVWLAALVIWTRLAWRPLARLATASVRQRDLTAAATEAERARIAADIHDDALQDLTMLIRRLDAAGDTANAQAAREIAERLRAICGDLRLPVLDDLGVGPALEWLCGRLGPTTAEIRLDRLAEESRLPADVELAVFRVAQEALSNAMRHGAPPLVVRYRAREGWVELEVDDSGAGLAEGAAETAEQTGHLGLLNMTQRAEAVGARLAIRLRPGGGTRVSFIWERASASAGAAVPAPA